MGQEACSNRHCIPGIFATELKKPGAADPFMEGMFKAAVKEAQQSKAVRCNKCKGRGWLPVTLRCDCGNTKTVPQHCYDTINKANNWHIPCPKCKLNKRSGFLKRVIITIWCNIKGCSGYDTLPQERYDSIKEANRGYYPCSTCTHGALVPLQEDVPKTELWCRICGETATIAKSTFQEEHNGTLPCQNCRLNNRKGVFLVSKRRRRL